MIVDIWLHGCAFDIVLPQHAHNHVKNTRRSIYLSTYFIYQSIHPPIHTLTLLQELQVFLLEGSKSDVWEQVLCHRWKMLRICIQILVSLSLQYLVLFKYLLNIMIVQNFTFAQFKQRYLFPTLFFPSECEMLTKSCLPMHHTCVVDNDISPYDISDDNIINNIIVQLYATILFCIVHLYTQNRITYSISIMYTYKCSLLLATCSQ